MGSLQQICLKWNNHQPNFPSTFEQLRDRNDLVDVTLACERQIIKAHKLVLSACSPFFLNIFTENPCQHPVVILKDAKYTNIQNIIEFMYKGEVNVIREELTEFLKTAEALQVKGLTEDTNSIPRTVPNKSGDDSSQNRPSQSSNLFSLPSSSHQSSSAHSDGSLYRVPIKRRRRRFKVSPKQTTLTNNAHPDDVELSESLVNTNDGLDEGMNSETNLEDSTGHLTDRDSIELMQSVKVEIDEENPSMDDTYEGNHQLSEDNLQIHGLDGSAPEVMECQPAIDFGKGTSMLGMGDGDFSTQGAVRNSILNLGTQERWVGSENMVNLARLETKKVRICEQVTVFEYEEDDPWKNRRTRKMRVGRRSKRHKRRRRYSYPVDETSDFEPPPDFEQDPEPLPCALDLSASFDPALF